MDKSPSIHGADTDRLATPIPQGFGDDRAEALLSLPFMSEFDRALATHWLNIADTRLCPERKNLRPEYLGSILPRTILYEFHSRSHIQFRIAGSLFRTIHGRELSGTNYLDLMSEPDRQKASDRLFGMTEQPCGLLTMNAATFASGRSAHFKTFGLPLADTDGSLRFAIMVCEYISEKRRPAYGNLVGVGAAEATYIDIGAGIPDNKPPY